MKIKFTVSNYRCFPTQPPAEFEIGTGVTAFIGENNAGKSAVLRLIHDLRELWASGASPTALNNLIRGHSQPRHSTDVHDPTELFFAHNKTPIRITLAASAHDVPELTDLKLTFTSNEHLQWVVKLTNGPDNVLVDDNNQLYQPDKPGQLLGDASAIVHALDVLAKSVYIPAWRHSIYGDGNSFDLPLGNRLDSSFGNLQSGTRKESNVLAREIEDSLGRLFNISGLRLLLTNSSTGGRQVAIPNLGQFRSDEIGAGQSQAFAALFVAITKRPSIIFIDEPELSLHPRLQLRFISELQRYAGTGLVFTTHNIGLAVNVADRIYSVVRQPGDRHTDNRPWSTISLFTETLGLSSLLGALSYPSYGDLADRHILLVEGPTDLRVVSHLLAQLKIEDRVIPLHVGGATTIQGGNRAKEQLAGIGRLCDRVWCLIDSEATCREDSIGVQRQSFIELCHELGIEVHATRRRALENYLSDAACKARFGPRARALGDFEKLLSLNCGWSKDQGWMAATKMKVSEFEDVYQFLLGIKQAVEARKQS